MHKELEKYLPLIEFLSGVLGENTEIVMHDLSDPDCSVVAIVNGHVSGRTVGAPATNLAMKFINERIYETCQYKLNYKGKGKGNKEFKSATYFIKDDDENVVGMLCINIDIEAYIKVRNELNKLISLGNISETEEFHNSIEEMASDYIDNAVVRSGVDVENLSPDEKINIIKELNDIDAFSYKGMVFNVAKKLKVSEPTVYRYLNKIKQA
ncbi:MAG: transcriptional regulator [Lachnospirales bacterium]